MVDSREEAVVVKVGGSLFDLADLGPRLNGWLDENAWVPVILVPGGGPTAKVVQEWDRLHSLGEETAHWLALQALTLNGQWLAHLLKAKIPVLISDLDEFRQKKIAIMDAHGFAREDEKRSGHLPHCWEATSDSLAARVAIVWGARRLILLKSVPIPPTMDWEEAGRQGFVDPLFAPTVKNGVNPIVVQAINFREWQPGRRSAPDRPILGPGEDR
jgi:5-(aminomethyl)-3-furanmethanol phosphate kinase